MSEKKKNWVPAIIALVVIVLVIIAVGVFKGQRFSGMDTLPVASFRTSPMNHVGNRYYLEAQIDSMILWEEGVGRLLAVMPNDGDGRLPMFVPDALQKSIHVGQRYRMGVSITNGGLIHVEDLEKF